MASTKSLIIFFIISCSFTKLIIAKDEEKPPNPIATSLCKTTSIKGTPPQYETYQKNVASLLSNLMSFPQSSIPGFYNTTVGNNPNDNAYGSYLCRGDLSSDKCHNCVTEATKQLLTASRDVYFDCVGMAGFDLNPDRCMVRYANRSTTYEAGRILTLGKIGTEVSNYRQYNQTLSTTVEELVREASYGNWSRPNFEERVVDVPGSDEKIYTLVQCTPEISPMNCSKCLGELYDYIPKCCNGTQGGWVMHANCLMQYDNQSFFGSGSLTTPSSYFHVCMVLLLSIYFLFM